MDYDYDMSIIMPCRNLQDCIWPMLQSLYNQQIIGYKIELIFVCDNCTDNTRQVIASTTAAFSHYSAIHIIEAQVGSCGYARNEGLKVARGKYIWFIDGDDWLLDDLAILKIIETFKASGNSLVRFGYKYNESFPYPNQTCMVWQWCFSRELIGNIRFTNIQPDEDLHFINAILDKLRKNATSSYSLINDTFYYYNWFRPGSNMYQYMTTGKVEGGE